MICLAFTGSPLDVCDDGRDPDGIETHVLDIVELAGDPFPSPTAVFALRGIACR